MEINSESTTIGQIFGFEIKLLQLWAGLLPEHSGTSRIIYCLFIIALTILGSFLIDDSSSRLDYFTSISAQYVIFIHKIYLWVSTVTVSVTALNGMRYRQAIWIILNKRLDTKYLEENKKITTLKLIRGVFSKIVSNSQDYIPKICLVKFFFTANICIVIIRVYLDYSILEFNDIKSDNVRKTSNTVSMDENSNTSIVASRGYVDSNYNHSFVSNIINEVLKFSPYSKTESFSSSKLWMITFQMVFNALLNLLRFAQNYGYIFISLSVTSTISDMLNFAGYEDGLMEKEHKETKMVENDTIVKQSDGSSSSISDREASTISKKYRRHPSLTTDLLIQARDVLIMLRCVLSLYYLVNLIADLMRMMSVFCILNVAVVTGRIDLCIIYIIEYLQLFFNMNISRIGHHWVHEEVNIIKRRVHEADLLVDSDISNSKGRNENMSLSERLTSVRLIDDIETIWPTDWFKPDIASCMRINVFVMTFVATLQQLVEGGSKIDNS